MFTAFTKQQPNPQPQPQSDPSPQQVQQQPPASNPQDQQLPPQAQPHLQPMPVPKFSLLKLVVGLFVIPRLAILAARYHKTWGKMLLLIAFSTFIFSGIHALQKKTSIDERCQSLATIVADNLFALTSNTTATAFDWDINLELPFSVMNDVWQLDVVDHLDAFSHNDFVSDKVDWGIVIAHDKIAAWTRDISDSNAIIFVDNFPVKTTAELFRTFGEPQDSGFRLDNDALHLLASSILAPVMTFMYGFQYAFLCLNLMFTCIFLFVVISLIFRWRTDNASFGAVFASSLACSAARDSVSRV